MRQTTLILKTFKFTILFVYGYIYKVIIYYNKISNYNYVSSSKTMQGFGMYKSRKFLKDVDTRIFPMKYFPPRVFMRRFWRSCVEFQIVLQGHICMYASVHFQFQKECFHPLFCVSRFSIHRGGIFLTFRSTFHV